MARGPAPGTGCQVCTHPDATYINAELTANVLSGRAIARKYGIGKDSVARHKWNRHPGYTPPGSAEATGDDGKIRTELERLHDIRTKLEEEMQRAPKADISRELRQVNAAIAEREGTDQPKAVTIADVDGLAEQVALWFEALEPYPEAREAMFLVTDKILLERAGLGDSDATADRIEREENES